MKSLFNIIQIYLENPSDKDMERVLERELTKTNTIKMYKKINDLERQLEEARGLAESAIVEAFNAGADIYHLSKELEQLKEKGDE